MRAIKLKKWIRGNSGIKRYATIWYVITDSWIETGYEWAGLFAVRRTAHRQYLPSGRPSRRRRWTPTASSAAICVTPRESFHRYATDKRPKAECFQSIFQCFPDNKKRPNLSINWVETMSVSETLNTMCLLKFTLHTYHENIIFNRSLLWTSLAPIQISGASGNLLNT